MIPLIVSPRFPKQAAGRITKFISDAVKSVFLFLKILKYFFFILKNYF